MPKFEIDNLFEFNDPARGETWKFRTPSFAEAEAIQKSSAGEDDAEAKGAAVLDFMACLMADYHQEIKCGDDVKATFGPAEITFYMGKIMSWMEDGLTENPTRATGAEKPSPSLKSSEDSEPSAPSDSDGQTKK